MKGGRTPVEKKKLTTPSGVRTPMSTDALIASVKRQVMIARHDPDFVNYIVSLALYLLEVNDGHAPADKIPEPRQGDRPAISAAAVRRLEEAAQQPGAIEKCRLCGAPTKGKRVCPSCGHMVG